jgi:hypothetical protein
MSRATNSLSPEEFQQLLAWYEIRDMMLGQNSVEQDVKKALSLAAICKHRDAVWLTELFAGHVIEHKWEAVLLFRERGSNGDQRALFFGAFSWTVDVGMLAQSAVGYAPAQASMVLRTPDEEGVRWAEKACAQGERNGFYWLGHCKLLGRGCERDEKTAREMFLIAAELGYVEAMLRLKILLDKTDPQRFAWMGRAAMRGRQQYFLKEMLGAFADGVERCKSDVLFVIGRALKGQMDSEKCTAFGETLDDSTFRRAAQAVSFFEKQLHLYRAAVDLWTFIGRRSYVVKDIRILIAKKIWNCRDEAKYKVTLV